MVHGFGLLRRGGFVGVLACSAAVAVAVPIAVAANTKPVKVGQLFTPTGNCVTPGTALATGVASGRSYRVPKAGVITSWSFKDGATPVSGLKLKVGRKVSGHKYKIVGSATAGTQIANTVNTYTTHIRVKAGDVIGIYEGGAGNCDVVTSNSLDRFGWAGHADAARGTTRSFQPLRADKFPVSVRLKAR
jgi:hypothetical protein